jgi:hypothetical protein
MEFDLSPLLAVVGGRKGLARITGVSRQATYLWLDTKKVPAKRLAFVAFHLNVPLRKWGLYVDPEVENFWRLEQELMLREKKS